MPFKLPIFASLIISHYSSELVSLNPISTGGGGGVPTPPICFFACNFFVLEPISPKIGKFFLKFNTELDEK